MKKKIIIKYILMYIPMVVGVILFSFKIINIVSSLLLFLGGYIAIKNTLDYRVVRKNIDKTKIIMESKNDYVPKKEDEKVSYLKRVRRKTRVRKREKD